MHPSTFLPPHTATATATATTATATTQPTRRQRVRWSTRHLLAGLALVAAGSSSVAQVALARLQLGALPVTMVYATSAAAQPQTWGPFTLQVALGAAPLPGVHRLVVLSHGTAGSNVADHDMAATLARAGFVVAQPLHQGDNHADARRAGPEAWATRPDEVRQVIDGLATHPAWQGRLQLDKVGVHGMSAGGMTAITLAGGQWRVLDLLRHCQANGEADIGFCYNGLATPQAQAQRRLRYDSAKGVPALLLPAEVTAVHGGRTPSAGSDENRAEVRPDARVASVSVSVPVAAVFTSDSLRRIRVPVGVVSAARDTMLPPEFHSARLLRDCPACQSLADLAAAAHMDLLSPLPLSLALEQAKRQPRGGLPEPGFDSRQRDAAFQAVAAFHRRHLGP